MALDNKKYENFYSTSGDGADKAETSKLTKAARDWDFERATGCEFYLNHPDFAPLIFQLQQMQDELTALRTEISANKDKVTFPGFGTSSSTALAGDTTVISSDQASAIAANTAKVSLAGGKGTALSFSEMITTPPPKGSKTPTYSIVMTAVESGVEKSVTLTLT